MHLVAAGKRPGDWPDAAAGKDCCYRPSRAAPETDSRASGASRRKQNKTKKKTFAFQWKRQFNVLASQPHTEWPLDAEYSHPPRGGTFKLFWSETFSFFFFFGVLKVESNSVVVMNGKMEGEEGRKCIYMETGPLKIRRSRLFHSGEEWGIKTRFCPEW